MQVAHFLEADLQPWATALADELFPPVRRLPGRRASEQTAAETGGSAPAPSFAASHTAARVASAWRRLDELVPLGDVVGAVLRAWHPPLREKLLLAPAEWQRAVLGSHVDGGALQLDFEALFAYGDAVHGLRGVRSLHLNEPSSVHSGFDVGAEGAGERCRVRVGNTSGGGQHQQDPSWPCQSLSRSSRQLL